MPARSWAASSTSRNATTWFWVQGRSRWIFCRERWMSGWQARKSTLAVVEIEGWSRTLGLGNAGGEIGFSHWTLKACLKTLLAQPKLVIPDSVNSGARFLSGSPARAVFACCGDPQRPNKSEGPCALPRATKGLRSTRSRRPTSALCPFAPKPGANGGPKARARFTDVGMTTFFRFWPFHPLKTPLRPEVDAL